MLEKKHLVFLAGATAPFAPPLCTALIDWWRKDLRCRGLFSEGLEKQIYKLGFYCDFYHLRTEAKQNYKPVPGKNKNALIPIVTWEHWKNYQELLMDNLPEIYFQVNDSNALRSIACVADVIFYSHG